MGAALGFCLFDTVLGACAVVWSEDTLLAVQLPEATAGRTRSRIQRSWPGVAETAPPPWVQAATARICQAVQGEPDALLDLPLDLQRVPPFHRRVYEIARAIPPGRTLTYGEVARQLGEPGAARAVGQALGHNPFAPVVPCHRVLAAGGRPGGFSAEGGALTKLKLLENERARFGSEPGLFDVA